MLKIKRALISVWDKRGIEHFAKRLKNLNIEILSTGKTAGILRRSGIEVRDVSSFTNFPEILSGRVKTLHPKIFGGVLVNKKHPLHIEEIKNLAIEPIDMVVVNFYPFKEKLKEKLTFEEMLEYIDIGGPALLRAGAKNFKNVACVSAPSQYQPILEELEKNNGFLSEGTLRRLAEGVFYLSKEYDSCIYGYFRGKDFLDLSLEKVLTLRYGENPHQKAGLYYPANTNRPVLRQLQGKELSFNNLLDLDTALNIIKEFKEPAAVIVKHASPCGVGIDKKKLSLAYQKAYLVDTLSSFGGVVALNRKVDKQTALAILKSEFKECITAPVFSQESLRLFSEKKNLILAECSLEGLNPLKEDIRTTLFGYLVEEPDLICYRKDNLKVVSKRKPTPREWEDLLFAWSVAKYVKSNAVVVAKNKKILGIGGGQPARVLAVKIALEKAKDLKGASLASDGFFPKEDAIKLAYRKGIRAIIQPGGSIKDKDLIRLVDSFKMAMVFTGIRHFRH